MIQVVSILRLSHHKLISEPTLALTENGNGRRCLEVRPARIIPNMQLRIIAACRLCVFGQSYYSELE